MRRSIGLALGLLTGAAVVAVNVHHEPGSAESSPAAYHMRLDSSAKQGTHSGRWNGTTSPQTTSPTSAAAGTTTSPTPTPSTGGTTTTSSAASTPSTAPTSANPSTATAAAAPTTSGSGVTLNLDMDTCDNSQWTTGNGGLEAGDPASQLQILANPTRSGTGCAARFETANVATDKVSNGTYRSLDAKYDSQEGTVGGQDFVYGFSFQVPAVPNYEHIWELHGRSNIYSINGNLSLAPHAILLRNGQLQYREMTGEAKWNGSSWSGWSNYQDQKVLDPAVQANTWYDVTVHIKASEGSDGLTEVYVRKAGQAWPTTPAWTNNGPSVQWVPGGLDPNVPTKRSNLDSVGGYSGMYLEAGIYSGGSSWNEPFSPVVLFMDDLRRYTDLTSARAGFPS